MELTHLFSEGKIGKIAIKNRIVRSATYTRRATKDGHVTDQLIDFYSELARGGVGLIISEFIAVEVGHTISQGGLCLYDDSYISGHKKFVDAIHEYSDIKIAAQLAHTGRQGSHPKYQPVAPSPIADKIVNRIPRELTGEEIRETTGKFVSAGLRAYESGYDMVQLHAAHGYLLSNFLSPYSNHRNDEFGGDTQRRTKVVIDIYDQIRDELGKDFPIIIKLQVGDFVPGGMTLDEGKEIVRDVVKTGFDAIEPSGGMGEALLGDGEEYPSVKIKSPEDENYFLPFVKEIRPEMKDCSIILMGGVKNPLAADQILSDGITDFISMSRPLIHEPDLPNRWKNGDLSPALCISCNNCYFTMLSGPVHCTVRKKKNSQFKSNK